jgi:GxxExxY protein
MRVDRGSACIMHHVGVPPEVNAVANQIVDAAFKVHTELGPGLLESSYSACLAHELRLRGLVVEVEVALPLVYEGLHVGSGYRIDMLVAGCVIVEIKAVEALPPVAQAQLLTYLKLSGIRLGYLINFNVPMLKEGLKRYIR